MSRILAYVRVSTEEQAASGAGLEAQRASILAESRRRNWSIDDVTFIEDAGFSGKDLKRPGIVQALDALKRGDADTLVVAKLDRLSRSMADLTRLLGVASKQGWALIALDVAVDTSTPTGEAMAHVIGTFSQLERRLIGQRTKEALAMRRAQGVRLGRPRTLPDDVAREIVARRAQGNTLQSIADELTDRGVPTAQGGRRWYASTIAKVLASLARKTPRGRCHGGGSTMNDPVTSRYAVRLRCSEFFVDVVFVQANERWIAVAATPAGPSIGRGPHWFNAAIMALQPFDGRIMDLVRSAPAALKATDGRG